ncbi:DUF1707 domain-containing protein [Nocardioides sp. zg-1308]|uniref:DUF1707 domain-containing protein n=1 Tax=Nocardioides renjunii TaxID=3095075 RepID=A0ABU5KFI1_9ACTN|nr:MULTISPECIES: DUF1707 domain-containing protein [unclassified Nocardioides]MDZ5663592.1 DUF1707 domain-containing protein [Nocardioides sp. S-58]NPD06979.1 DUF1707 domain-containing protein [Nocardioides sp. zg-1308]WQQ20676.1 DUF1707 domain-containing protein [Nocardioides sp. S-34]
MPGIEVWSQFDHDPRLPANAPMRASDRDRAVIETVLADAFAEGRLTRAEYDERSDAAIASRTLGDLMPLVADLPVTRAPRSSLPEAAERAYVQARRQAVWGFLSASLICWAIWVATSFGGDGFTAQFPWPLFVMLGTGLNAGRVVWQKDEIVEEETRRLEKRERKELRRRDEGL